MKRYAAILVAAVAVTAMMPAGVARAAVTGTPHDVTVASPALTDFGVCSACHIPHRSLGARLWPSDMSGAPAARGEVGQLCTFCHGPALGQIAAAQTPYPFKDQMISTHGLAKVNAPDGTNDLDTALPYVTAPGDLQCTSCHNVHDNSQGSGAFLQDDIDVLCARCHPNRQFVGGAQSTPPTQGDWGNFYGYDPAATNGNPGSHPVGQDVFTDTDGAGNSPITTGIIGVVDYGNASTYNLGPHLIDGGTTWQAGNGMGCVTCHTPHGTNYDDNSVSADPNPDLLTIAQSEMGSVANGNGDPNDALCEACHRGDVPAGTSAFFPNPGSLALWTHPVDDYYPTGDVGVSAVPVNWPTGSGGENSPDLICESCHIPHPLAAMDADSLQPAPPVTGSNTHLLRDEDISGCSQCHTGTYTGHHPIGPGLMDGTLFWNPLVGDQDNDMECADCHFGNGGHNWSGESEVGLDPDWEPPDNGRPADRLAAGPSTIPDTSKECVDCHTFNGRMSPTRPNVAGEFQNSGDASHWLGTFFASGWVIGGPQAGGNFTANHWLDGGADSITGWSRFAGSDMASAIFVCESCHDLEPEKNDGNNAMLLANFTENIAEPRNLLCEGCHSPSATAVGAPHPMTGDTITKAVTMGRGTTTLITSTVTGYADDAAAPDENTTYPAVDQMNCDSCHQVHNAVDAGGTYILEAGAGVTGNPAGAITLSYASGAISWAGVEYDTSETGVDKLNYQTFCNLCHASGE